jgi:hypothetical protein
VSKDDPYHDSKPYHMANLVSSRGDVSPICAIKPKALDLKRELWSFRWEAVTCGKCLAKRSEGIVDASRKKADLPA